jgi:hypothetical protein
LARYANIFGTNLWTTGDRSASNVFSGNQWRLVWLRQFLRRLPQFCRERLLHSSCLSVRLFAWNNSALSVRLFAWNNSALSVRLFARNNSAPTERISMNLDIWLFLGAFEKFRKTTIYLVMSVYLFVRTEQIDSHWTNVDGIWVFKKKIVEKIQVSLKSDKNNGYFTWRPT